MALRSRRTSWRQLARVAVLVAAGARHHRGARERREAALAIAVQVWARSARIPLDRVVRAISGQLRHGALAKNLVSAHVVHADRPEGMSCHGVLTECNEGPHVRLAIGPRCLRAFGFHPPLEAPLRLPCECRLRASDRVPREATEDRINVGTRAPDGLVPAHLLPLSASPHLTAPHGTAPHRTHRTGTLIPPPCTQPATWSDYPAIDDTCTGTVVAAGARSTEQSGCRHATEREHHATPSTPRKVDAISHHDYLRNFALSY